MKRFLLTPVFLLFLLPLKAQHKAIDFTVNGLKVILRPTEKETVSIRMFYRGGVMNYAPEQAGIENMALTAAATGGSKKYSAADYKELNDEFGIEIQGSSGTDYGTITMDCISKYLDKGWNFFADAVANPVFEQQEFQSSKEKTIARIHSQNADPESRIEKLSMSAIFQDSPYSTDPTGTEEIVTNFRIKQIKDYYYQTLLNKNRMFLVVAGKITREELEKKIMASLSSIPEAPYTPPVYDQKLMAGEKLLTEQRDLATNYMSCVMNAPPMNKPDYLPFMLSINALSSHLFYELRTKQSLSYSPGATTKSLQIPYMSMYVSTTQPAKAYQAIITVYKSMRSNLFSQSLLDDIKKNHKRTYYRHQESSSAIVEDLGKAEIFGDYKIEENKIASINKVSLQDMLNAINRYLKGAIWIYLGDEQAGKAAFQ